MATSLEKNKVDIFKTQVEANHSISKIPKKNNTKTNSGSTRYVKMGIEKVSSVNNTRPVEITTRQPKSTKSQTPSPRSQQRWTVQPTEKEATKRSTIATQKTFNVQQRFKLPPKKSNQKLKEKMAKFGENEPNDKVTSKPANHEAIYVGGSEPLLADVTGHVPMSCRANNISSVKVPKYEPTKIFTYSSTQGREKKQIFRLNAETVKEIEAPLDTNVDYNNIKRVMNSETIIGNIKAACQNDNTVQINGPDNLEISTLLSARTEELLRSKKTSRRSPRDNRGLK